MISDSLTCYWWLNGVTKTDLFQIFTCKIYQILAGLDWAKLKKQSSQNRQIVALYVCLSAISLCMILAPYFQLLKIEVQEGLGSGLAVYKDMSQEHYFCCPLFEYEKKEKFLKKFKQNILEF